MSDIWGALAGKAADLVNDTITGAINNYYGRKAGSRANNYALYMSSTAHQREVNDLRMAGLNPVLSALGNGAATVSVPVHGGQQPQTSSLSSHISANSARKVGEQQQQLLAAQRDNTEAQTAKSKAEAELAEAEAEYVRKQGMEAFRKKYEPSGVSHTSWIIDNVFKPVSDWTGEKIGKPLYQFLEGEGGRNSASSIEHDINAIRLRQYEMLKPWMFYHEGKRYWKFPDGHATSDFERAVDLIPKYWKDLQKEKLR